MKLSFNQWALCKWLLVLCILFSPIVGIQDLMEAFYGVRYVPVTGWGFITRLLRDVLIVLFYIYFGWCYFFRRRPQFFSHADFAFIFTVSVGALVSIFCSVLFSFIFLNIRPFVIFLGLKTFLYLPLFIIAWIFLRQYPSAMPALRNSILIVLAVQLIIGLIQIFYMPPIMGASFLGSLPIGTFTHYLIFGAFLCTFIFGHLFVRNFKMPAVLFVATVLMILFCGSRTAVMVLSLLFLLWAIKNLSSRFEWRGIITAMAPLLVISAVLIAPMLSGREVVVERGGMWVSSDPRVGIWLDYFGRDLNALQLALGSGVGLASNAVNVIYGKHFFQGQFIADSLHLALLAQYGFVGFVLIYLALALLLYKLYRDTGIIACIMIGLFGFGNIFLENYPANLITPILLALHSEA